MPALSILTKAGEEAAQKAAITAAKQASEAAAKKAAQEAAQKAAQAAAKKSAMAAAAAAATAASVKAAKDAAETAAAKAAKTASTQALEKASAEALEKASKTVTKAASEAESAAAKIVKQTDDDVAKASKNFIAKNPKLVAGGVGAAGLAGYAELKFKERNNKTLSITKIEQTGANSVQITFTPALKLLKTDKVDILATNCSPVLNALLVPIQKIVSDTSINVAGNIVMPGNTGKIVTHSSFEGQLVGAMVDAGGAVAGVGAQIAGGVADKALTAAGLPNISDMIAKLTSYKYYAMAFIVIALALKFWPSGQFMGQRRRVPQEAVSLTI